MEECCGAVTQEALGLRHEALDDGPGWFKRWDQPDGDAGTDINDIRIASLGGSLQLAAQFRLAFPNVSRASLPRGRECIAQHPVGDPRGKGRVAYLVIDAGPHRVVGGRGQDLSRLPVPSAAKEAWFCVV